MKFIHMADVHLDMAFTSLRHNKKIILKRRIEHKKVFKDVINLAKTEDIDFLFISGDLFEQKYVEDDTIKYIISCFNEIPNVNIFISPGNHDPYIRNSPYKTYVWPANVHIFGSEIEKYLYDNISIYGLGFDNYEIDSDKLLNFKIENKDEINILVTHGTLNGATHKYHDINSKALEQFDYVALGHIHDKKVDNSKIIYPGSLISCGFDELGQHGIVIGEINKENLKIEFRNMDYRQTEIMEIDISKYKNIFDVLNEIKLSKNIYRIVLTGERNIRVDELIEALQNMEYDICDIEDKTYMSYKIEEIAMQKTLKGIFTKNMLEILKKGERTEEEVMSAIEYVYKNM